MRRYKSISLIETKNIGLCTMNRKQKDTDEIVRNELFNKISQCTDDEEWKKIFQDMAVGKFLPGFRCSGRKITYQRNGSPTYITLNEDPKLALDQCQKFIYKKTAGFKTQQEREENMKKTEEKAKKGWTVIKKLPIQRQLLHYYIDNIAKEKGLSTVQTNELRTTIFIACINKELKKRVVISDGQIKAIDNLDWDNAREKWVLR